MKSREDFASEDRYGQYLYSYYLGQALIGVITGVQVVNEQVMDVCDEVARKSVQVVLSKIKNE